MASQIFLLYQPPKSTEVEYYELTCTTDVVIDKRNTVSDLPVEAGFVVADNSFSEPTRFTLKGVLTDIVNITLDHHRPPEEAIKGLHRLMDEGAQFTLAVDQSLDLYENTNITALSIVKSSGMGTSWKVNLDMKQTIVTKRAVSKVFPPQQPDTEKQAKAKRRQGDNNTESEDKNPTAGTLFSQWLSRGGEVFKNNIPFAGAISDITEGGG